MPKAKKTLYRFLKPAVLGTNTETPWKRIERGHVTEALAHWNEILIDALIRQGAIEIVEDATIEEDNPVNEEES